jgi:hypothetical protein
MIMSYQAEVPTKQASYHVNAAVLLKVSQEYILIGPDVGVGTARDVVLDTFATSEVVTNCNPIASTDMMLLTFAPKSVQEYLRFKELVKNWRASRNPLSSSAWDNMNIPAYQQIIGMGEAALPFIFTELQNELKEGEPDDWFAALWAITDANPIPSGSRGKIREMAEAWIDWGLLAGYINGETLGVGISVFGAIRRPQSADQWLQLLCVRGSR